MECTLKIVCILLLMRTCLIKQINGEVSGEPQVPCYFIFGDSLPDAGNNNALLPGGLKSNYLPYGVDFYVGPTGRFSNNRTAADILGQLLGFQSFIPPFSNLTNSSILNGVNYASAGSGIRDDTGLLGTRISLNMQLSNHQTIVRRIQNMLGSAAANDRLNKCIYTVTTANNDYIANYYMPLSLTKLFYPLPQQYATVLVTQLSQQLRRLYNQGARKIGVYGLAQLGCTPFVINTMGKNGSGCVDNINAAAAMFNTKLRSLVDQLNNNTALPGANFTYLNAYTELTTLLGPVVTNSTCCEIAAGSPSCVRNGSTCDDRNSTVFYDALHPTDAANVVFAGISYKARTPQDAHPYDISQLAAAN